MKIIKLVSVAVLLSGILSACNNQQPAPAVDAAPAVAPEPAAAPEPVAAAPAADAAAMPATDAAPADQAAVDDNSTDMPQSGGDKVGVAPAPAN